MGVLPTPEIGLSPVKVALPSRTVVPPAVFLHPDETTSAHVHDPTAPGRRAGRSTLSGRS